MDIIGSSVGTNTKASFNLAEKYYQDIGKDSPPSANSVSCTPPRKLRPMYSRSLSKPCFRAVDDETLRCIGAQIVSMIDESKECGYEVPFRYNLFCRECTPEALHPDSNCLASVMFILTIIHEESQMEYECVLIALIYMQRLVSYTHKDFRVCALNWRHTLLVCMLVASKVWDDFSINNGDFADIFDGVSLSLLNRLESFVLAILDFDLLVSDKEFDEVHSKIQNSVRKSQRLCVYYDGEFDIERMECSSDVSSISDSGKTHGYRAATYHKVHNEACDACPSKSRYVDNPRLPPEIVPLAWAYHSLRRIWKQTSNIMLAVRQSVLCAGGADVINQAGKVHVVGLHGDVLEATMSLGRGGNDSVERF